MGRNGTLFPPTRFLKRRRALPESPFDEELLRTAEFEQIQILKDEEAGLLGFVAIHSTRLGPAFGGIRRFAYTSPAGALRDALRLAAHMSLKCAIHGIPGGGGKAVLLADPRMDRHAAYRRLGDYVEAMGGRYYTGPDVGTEPDDLLAVAARTRFVARPDELGPGNLAEPTAVGVLAGIRAAARRLGREDLEGVHVTVQGLGEVGWRLVEKLAYAGARLSVSDVVSARVAVAAERFGAAPVVAEHSHRVECDVYAPCALGGVVSESTIDELGAAAIAGSANNVLADPALGAELHRRGVVYAPDFVINSGALVHGALFHLKGEAPPLARIEEIEALLLRIFATAEAEGVPPEVVADREARARLESAGAGIYVPGR